MTSFPAKNPLETVGLARDFVEQGTSAASVKELAMDEKVLERARIDSAPLPPAFQRINYYGDDHLGYWLSGLQDMRTLRSELVERSIPVKGPILDFGASTGRVARHWSMEPERFRVHACELTPRMVKWMDVHLKGRVTPLRSESTPPLPYKTSMFGLVYAYSVFTHIFDEEQAWLKELARVTKPTGVVALTIHNENTWAKISNLKFRIRDLLQANAEYQKIMLQGGSMPDRLQLVQDGISLAFYSNRHVNAVWSKYFKVIDIIDNGHQYQSVVLLSPR